MRLNYKLWLEENGKIFGEGPCAILYQVEQLGSLKRAADSFQMSYSKAWTIIKNLEERMGFKILHSYTGGSRGGGSKLTREGKILMERYTAFQEEAQKILEELEEKWFNDTFWEDLQGPS